MLPARLEPHQQQTLREELASERYKGLSRDDAYAEVTARPNALRLARTHYEGIGKNLPGFPNKVRRADFDLIWSKINGST